MSEIVYYFWYDGLEKTALGKNDYKILLHNLFFPYHR